MPKSTLQQTLQTKANNPYFVVVVGPEGTARDMLARRIYEHIAWVAPVEFETHFLDQAEVDSDNIKQFIEVVNSYLDWGCKAIVVSINNDIDVRRFVQAPHQVVRMTASKPKQPILV